MAESKKNQPQLKTKQKQKQKGCIIQLFFQVLQEQLKFIKTQKREIKATKSSHLPIALTVTGLDIPKAKLIF